LNDGERGFGLVLLSEIRKTIVARVACVGWDGFTLASGSAALVADWVVPGGMQGLDIWDFLRLSVIW
jgi:hypothetical protein